MNASEIEPVVSTVVERSTGREGHGFGIPVRWDIFSKLIDIIVFLPSLIYHHLFSRIRIHYIKYQ